MGMSSAPQPQMASGFISNLINGISQQPSTIRFPSQADVDVNHMPTLQEELARRNPLEVLFKLAGVTIDANSYVHFYRRDSSEAYAVIVNGTGIQVYSLIDGTAKTVNISVPGGDTYHQPSTPKLNTYCYTYKDTTFFINRSAVPAMKSAVSSSRTPEALIKVKDCTTNYKYDVTLTINGTAYTMPTKTAASTDDVNTIAAAIVTGFTGLGAWAGSGATISAVGNTVWVSHPTNSIVQTVKDNRSGTAIQGFTNTLQKSSDLPYYAPNGYLVKVVGSTSSQNAQDQNTTDDVIYRFSTDDNSAFASGVWKESVAAGIQYQLDPATMPHQLVRNSDGTFTYGQITWVDRKVGDDTTNPIPAFIGQKIHSCYLASNRFCINFAGYSMASKVDEQNYFNFWKTTILTGLDTDPVLMPVPSSQVNKVYWGTQWNGGLMLFGENLDATVSFSSTFAPNKIAIDTPTRFGITTKVAPVLSGGSLFFPKNRGDFSILYEYHLDPVTSLKDADNLTDYCGSYIPKDVIQMGGTEKDFLVMLTDADRTKLYCYNYSKKNSRLVQQAFHHWEFDAGITIYGIFVDVSTLYVLYGLAGNVSIGQIIISVGAKDTNYPSKCYMDSRIQEDFSGVSIAYNATTDWTTISLPFSFGTTKQTVELRQAYTNPSGIQYPVGDIPQIASQTSTSIVLVGNWTGANFFIGLPFESYYDPCRFHMYTPNPDGSGTVADTWKDITLKRLNLNFNNTGYFEIQVIDRVTGNVIQTQPMPLKLDSAELVFDSYKLYTGSYMAAIRKPLNGYKIRLRNNTTRPHFFTGLAWYGEYFDGKA